MVDSGYDGDYDPEKFIGSIKVNYEQVEKIVGDGLSKLPMPRSEWDLFVSYTADGTCKWADRNDAWDYWDPDWALNLKGEQVMPAEQQFDWAAASIGAAVGFASAYAVMKAFRGRNKDDEFNRI